MQEAKQAPQPSPTPEITPKDEAVIKDVMEAHPGITREEVIEYMIAVGGL